MPEDKESGDEIDPWADFYIAGESDLQLLDGLYYMDFYANGQQLGVIEVMVEGENASLNRAQLKNYLFGSISSRLEELFFNSAEEWISLAEIEEGGVSTSFDPILYTVELAFSAEDLPVQILSISKRSGRSGFISRPLGESIKIDPAAFTLVTRHSLETSFNLRADRFKDAFSFTYSASHKMRLLDLHGSLSYSVDFKPGTDTRFNLGSWNMYVDFPSVMGRLSWGNVSTDLLSPSGTSVGVRWDTSLFYSDSSSSSYSQVERMLTLDKDSEVTIYNGTNEIYRSILKTGQYRLRDFILYSGANNIRIVVSPLDGSGEYEVNFDVNFSSSLLAPGEFYYGAAIATGRELANRDSDNSSMFSLPYFNNSEFRYDLRRTSVSAYARAGLTEELTMGVSAALYNNPSNRSSVRLFGRLNTELTHANIFGAARYTFLVNLDSDNEGTIRQPNITTQFSQQFPIPVKALSSISLSLRYASPTYLQSIYRHLFSISAGFNGRIGIMSWYAGLSGQILTNDLENPNWALSSSLSFSVSGNVSLSTSLSFSGSALDMTSFSGRIYATVRFKKATLSSSVDTNGNGSSTLYYSGSDYSMSARTSTPSISDYSAYSIGADFSTKGKYFAYDLDFNSSSTFDRAVGSLTISTSTIFADGLLGISSTSPSSFALVRQRGALKGNTLQYALAGVSSTNVASSFLGTYLITDSSLFTSGATMYSIPDDGFSSSRDFTLSFTEKGQGYRVILSSEFVYSVSGIVDIDGDIWVNGSSPLYRVEIIDNRLQKIDDTDAYLFTDSSGRFIQSDLISGCYGFDVYTDEGWCLVIFNAGEEKDRNDVKLLASPKAIYCSSLPEEYIAVYSMTNDGSLSSEEFWNLLYPEAE